MGGDGVSGIMNAFSFSFVAKELTAPATYLHQKLHFLIPFEILNHLFEEVRTEHPHIFAVG